MNIVPAEGLVLIEKKSLPTNNSHIFLCWRCDSYDVINCETIEGPCGLCLQLAICLIYSVIIDFWQITPH